MSDSLVLLTILLGSEAKVNANGSVESMWSDGGAIDGDGSWDLEGCIAQAERVAKATTASMLARPEQVEVAHEEEVSNGCFGGISSGKGIHSVAQQRQGDRFDSLCERVTGLPRALHLLEGQDNIASRI